MSVPAVTPPTTAESVKGPTEYVVLRASDDMDLWAQIKVGRVYAPSATAAIKKAADGQPGTYVAVPARSWQPRTLTVKTEQRVSLS